jgi:hypothetical protein
MNSEIYTDKRLVIECLDLSHSGHVVVAPLVCLYFRPHHTLRVWQVGVHDCSIEPWALLRVFARMESLLDEGWTD